MLILVDIGNSRAKWGIARAGDVDGPWPLGDGAAGLVEVLDDAWGEYTPEAVVVASVAEPQRLAAVASWTEARWGIAPAVVRSQVACGDVATAYADATTLGVDRWANLLGLRRCAGARDAVVADVGTAVTVDGLRSDGHHVGGAILPGWKAGQRGLQQAAPGLPEPEPADGLPATATRPAIGAGLTIGMAGALERVAREIARALDGPPALYITGGAAGVVGPHLEQPWRHDPALTLRGLAAAWEDGCAGSR